MSSLSSLDSLAGGRPVRKERLVSEARWSSFTRVRREIPSGYVEFGELCRVHRGQVTGANHVWIAGAHSAGLPGSLLLPTITRAHELFEAGSVLSADGPLRRVIDIPADLSNFKGQELAAIEAFLKIAEKMGARNSYTANHRSAWWTVGLHEPAVILATYMARRPPAFVLNRVGARHINIAHGLYPRDHMSAKLLNKLVLFLRTSTSMSSGREYAGGLTKFEPREMERIPVPQPVVLTEMPL